MPYFPPPHPALGAPPPDAAGLDPAALAAAARFAAEHETPWSRDLAHMVATDFGEAPPWNETLGPVRPRGGPNGLVLRGGQIVAEWGDTAQVDLTFSVAKSYLSILAGLAGDRGLIRDLDEPVAARQTSIGDDGGFDPPHNDKITWHHLLQQTSEWEGELWGKPDLIDRNRSVGGRPAAAARRAPTAICRRPGTFWEYNDVRVNRLSLALLRLWRRPLPEVFRELVMDPIGASPDWEWHGYRNSYVEIDGAADAVGRRAARIGAAASSSTPGTRRGSACCCCAAACGRAGASCPRTGSRGCACRARSTRNTAICGGSTPAARCIRARRRRAIAPAAPAAT